MSDMFNFKKKWKPGIPKYKEKDLLTEADKLNMAMEAIMNHELSPNGYKIIAANNHPGQIPNFVCEKDGKKIFIVVKVAIAPEMPSMTVEQKKHLLEHARKFGAECFFAPVGLGATDPKRFEMSLALKNDSYYIRYEGLEPVQMKASKDWIQKALQEIEELKPSNRDYIQYSDRSYNDDFFHWKEHVNKQTFQERLMQCIADSGMTNQEFYKAAFMDRKLFSAMNTNPSYQPKKETAVACCFGLKLSLNEAEKLLKLAGYSLSMSIAWDRVVYYCITNDIFDIDIVNELLYEEGEKCIRV